MSETPEQPPQSYLPPIPVPPPPPGGGFLPDYQPLPPSRSFTWMEIWQMALTQPNEKTYEKILDDPLAAAQRGYLWIAVAYTVSFLIQFAGRQMGGTNPLSNTSAHVSPVAEIVCLPFIGAIGIIFFIIIFGMEHLVARLLGGQGRFDDMVYANAAWSAPLSVVSAALSLVPCINCFGFLLGLYGLVLNVIAVKTVHRFDVGRAALTVFWWVPLLCLCSFLFICLAGPAVSNVVETFLTEQP